MLEHGVLFAWTSLETDQYKDAETERTAHYYDRIWFSALNNTGQWRAINTSARLEMTSQALATNDAPGTERHYSQAFNINIKQRHIQTDTYTSLCNLHSTYNEVDRRAHSNRILPTAIFT